MRHPTTRIRKTIGRWCTCERAVAAVEFALVVPIMLTLYVGSIELSQLIIADQRVTIVAGTIGDLVARKNQSISKAEVESYFAAAQVIMTPMPSDGVGQVVSVVSVDAAGMGTVMWSQSYPAGTPKPAAGTAYDLSRSAAIRDLAKGKSLVVSEARYAHEPLLGMVFNSAFQLHRENFYLPRYGTAIRCDDC